MTKRQRFDSFLYCAGSKAGRFFPLLPTLLLLLLILIVVLLLWAMSFLWLSVLAMDRPGLLTKNGSPGGWKKLVPPKSTSRYDCNDADWVFGSTTDRAASASRTAVLSRRDCRNRLEDPDDGFLRSLANNER